jgi:GT2 family glycosyltransferase
MPRTLKKTASLYVAYSLLTVTHALFVASRRIIHPETHFCLLRQLIRRLVRLKRASIHLLRTSLHPLIPYKPKPRLSKKRKMQTSVIIQALTPKIGRLQNYDYKHRGNDKLVHEHLPFEGVGISIVIPSYNQGQFIERTLTSVLNQSYPKLELFVQDNHSTDQTAAVLERYQHRLTGCFIEKDSGQSEAINRGFARSNEEIMAWLNSDDVLLPNTLFTVGSFFHHHPDVDVLYGNRLLIDEDDGEIGRWILPKHDSEVLSWADFVPQETLFWRRTMWLKIGGRIDESFRFAMDWDLLLRFRNAGAKFAHIPRFLGAFRVHDNQKTSAEINKTGTREMDIIRTRELGRSPRRREIRVALLPYTVAHMAADVKYALWGQK